MKKLSLTLFALVFSLLLVSAASAVPIIYTFTGTASGQLGNTSFLESEFELIGYSDTIAVFENQFGFPIYQGPLYLGASFNIAGVGSGNFDLPGAITVFNNYEGEFLAFRRFDSGSVPSFLDMSAPGMGLDTWDHTFSIGPVTGFAGTGGPVYGGILPTDRGDLYFDYAYDVVFNAVVAEIPIPVTFWLFASALGLLGWLRRRDFLEYTTSR